MKEPEIDAAAAEEFALALEEAESCYVALGLILEGCVRFQLVAEAIQQIPDPLISARIPSVELTVQMSLARQFLDAAARAHRICELHRRNLPAARAEADRFLVGLGDIAHFRLLRDQEGGKKGGGRRKRSGGISLDVETALVVFNDKVMMGSIDLFEKWRIVRDMANVAGLKALEGRRGMGGTFR